MSQASELLNNLTEEELAAYTTNSETEPHIVINDDRTITIPSELKKIGVQYDHNVETVTFDCPRYWDGLDMSTMIVYVNYRRSDGYLGSYIADNVRVSDEDDNTMCFEWTLSRQVTHVKGNLSFLVCVKKTDEYGEEVNHWNSELSTDVSISEGLECGEPVVDEYPDIITQLLIRMDNVEDGKSAYDIAVKHGFEGTEEEWLDSLGVDPEDVIEALQPTVVNDITDGNLLLAHNQMARLGTLTEIILSVPDEIPQYYESEFSFTAGGTISIVYSETPIQWRGDDCDDPYDFYPQAGRSYEVSVKYLGNDTDNNPILVARVGVF